MTWSNNLHAFYAFQIHWLSIINSVVLVFLLIGFVVIILVNTCRSLWYYCWLVHVLIERIYMAVPRYEMSFGLLNNANEWIFFSQEHKFNMNMFYLLLKHQWNYHTILPLIFSVKGVFFMLQKQWWSFYVWGYFARKNQWGKQWWHRKRLAVFSGYLRNSVYLRIHFKATLSQPCSTGRVADHRPIRLTQCCTQFKSPGVKILCVLYLHYNVAFTFKWYGNSWNKTFYSQRVWIG